MPNVNHPMLEKHPNRSCDIVKTSMDVEENEKENELQVEGTVAEAIDKEEDGNKCWRISKQIFDKKYMILCAVLICTSVAIFLCVTFLINSNGNYYLTTEII